MIILSIETSCDETAVSLIRANGDFPTATYEILGNALFSQIDIHKEYGGVFPQVAKREHARTLVPMLEKALTEANLLTNEAVSLEEKGRVALTEILTREPGLGEQLLSFLSTHGKPAIDLIAVTSGPGLEPALWVGINFARALSYIWNIPLVPVNHMEGHVLSSIFDGVKLPSIVFPAIALLVSGGHTELVRMNDWATYELLGATRDDAVGEAFDKVARMLGLPYPGGPEVGKLAAHARTNNLKSIKVLPRPMIDSKDYDFSFSGIKTSVRYAIGQQILTSDQRAALAGEFENAVVEVLLKKSLAAIQEFGGETLIIGGGVSANTYLREQFTDACTQIPGLTLFIPDRKLSTDNSIMIALAGHARMKSALSPETTISIKADGNLPLAINP